MMMIRPISTLKSIAIACGVCVIVCLALPAGAQTESPASNSANDDEIASLLRAAELAKENGNFDKASELIGIALNTSDAQGDDLKRTLLIALQYADSLEAINSNTEAVNILNRIGIDIAGPSLAFERGSLFEKLGWANAMFSERRVAHRLDPKAYSEPSAMLGELLEFAPADLLSDESIANIARRSTVGVRVQGIVEGKDAKTGAVQVRASIRWAVGTVLDSFGTFLISSESVRVPTYGELFVPETQAVDRGSNGFATLANLTDKLGSTRWLKPLEIEIYSLPSETAQSKSMGEAVLMGTDEATGLAVIAMKRRSAFAVTHHSEWQPAKFNLEYRNLDPNFSQLASGYELNYAPTDFITVPSVVTRPSTESTICAYFERPSGLGHKARLIAIPGSKSLPGTPLFNQLGEIVGIKHQVDAPATDGQFAIPAHVCTRIAAKLAAYAEVDRAFLPFVMVSTNTGVKEPKMGMKVIKVPADVSIYQPLLNKLIVSLDGLPTPTLTEWLIASERVDDRGLKTALVEVFDLESKLVSSMTIPLSFAGDVFWVPKTKPESNNP